MTKRHSKGLFVVFSILLAIGIIACFVNFTYPFSMNGKYYSYSSFVSNMKLGEDVGKSYRIVYRAESHDEDNNTNYTGLKDSTITKLKSILQGEGYRDVTITGSDDRIVLQIGNIINDTDISNIDTLIGEPQTISFYMSEKSETNKPFATYKDITNVSALDYYDNNPTSDTYGQTLYCVRVDFKEELKDTIANLTADGGTMYIYLGDETFSQMDLGGSSIDQGMIIIQNKAFVDHATANTYANKIKTGMLDLKLTTLESAPITASYGVGNHILLPVAMLVFLIIAFVYLIVKYKQMGWLACFNTLFFVVISLFIMQSIPLAHFNFAALIGMLVGLLVMIDGMTAIFERAKEHFNQGIELHIAFKLAQKESMFSTIITNVLMFLTGFVCVFMPNLAIQSFGWVALILPFISVFANLALMRLFIKMYLVLNNTDGKKLNFHKGGKNA